MKRENNTWKLMTENFPKCMSRHLTTDSGVQRTPSGINAQQKVCHFKWQKVKIREKPWRKPEEKITSPIEKQK